MRIFLIVVILVWCFLSTGCNKKHENCFQPDDDNFIAPCAFTPNGDGKNDIFEVVSRDGKKLSLEIYTLAGALVFSIEAERCRWDGYSLSGQEMPTGIYYYTAEILDSSSKLEISGFVHLYR